MKISKQMKVYIIILLVPSIFAFIYATTDHAVTPTATTVNSANQQSQTNTDVDPTPIPSAAAKLASLDTGRVLSQSDPIVEKYQTQFDSLRAYSKGINDTNLSNMAYGDSQSELKKGTEESSLSILEAVNQAYHRANAPQEIGLSEMFAAYVTLRDQGMSKEQAIEQSESFIKAMK